MLCAWYVFVREQNFHFIIISRSVHELMDKFTLYELFSLYFAFSAVCWKCISEQIIASFSSHKKRDFVHSISESKTQCSFGGKWVSALQTNLFALIHSISIWCIVLHLDYGFDSTLSYRMMAFVGGGFAKWSSFQHLYLIAKQWTQYDSHLFWFVQNLN